MDVRWVSVLSLVAVGCHQWGSCDTAEQAPLPDELGIEDDDGQWLCDDRPERAKNDPNLGFKIAGAESCVGGEHQAVSGSDIYVSTDGSDKASGNSPDHALATVAEALCRVQPGQVIHIAPGTYKEAAAVAALGSSHSDPITIRGEGDTPEDVVLDGEYWRSAAFTLGEAWHVTIENLTVQHYTDAGIQTQTGSDITIDEVISRSNGRCSVNQDYEGEGFGVNLVGTTNITVTNSTFEDNGPLLARVLCGDVLGTGINTFEASGTISGNTIRRTRGGAMLVEDGKSMVVKDNIAESNYLLAIDNYWDAALWVDGSHDIEVTGNQFHDNWGGAGIEVSDEEGAYPETSKNITIADNEIRNHAVGVLVWGYGSCPPPSDAIVDYDALESNNTLTDNGYGGSEKEVVCDPDFMGGSVPQ